MKKQILLIVECYSGTGHMSVVAEAAKNIAAWGHHVIIAASESSFKAGKNFDYGPAEIWSLPGYDIDADGLRIQTSDGPIQTALQQSATRAYILNAQIATRHIDSVVVEGWPFGLDMFDDYFLNVMNYCATRGIPRYGLARDILGYPQARTNPSTGQPDPLYHDATSVLLANHALSGVLVAADPRMSLIEDSLRGQSADMLNIPVFYTGYFGAGSAFPKQRAMPFEERPVLIAGSGQFKGYVSTHMGKIMEAIASAKPYTPFKDHPLVVTLGEATDADVSHWQSHLENLSQGPVAVHTSLKAHDFLDALSNAAFVMHKGSRNVAVNCLQAMSQGFMAQGIVPLEDEKIGVWPEAQLRADALARHNLSVTFNIADLMGLTTTKNLIEKAYTQAKQRQSQTFDVNLTGARTLAQMLTLPTFGFTNVITTIKAAFRPS